MSTLLRFPRPAASLLRALVVLCVPGAVPASAQRIYLEGHGTAQWPVGGSFHSPKPQGGWGGVLGGRLSGAWGVEARITSKDVVESDTAEFSKHNEVVVAARYLFVHGAFTWHAAAGPVFIAGQEATTGIYQFSEVEGDVYEFRRTTTYKGRAGLGGLAAFGFTFQDPYNPGLAFLAEVNARLASWRPKEAMVDEYRKVEEGFTLVSETETSYVETYSGNDGPAFPMSSWGFRVGLQFRIGAIKKAGGPAEKAGQ